LSLIQALNHNPITVHGDGGQTGSFLYILDAVNALVRMVVRASRALPDIRKVSKKAVRVG